MRLKRLDPHMCYNFVLVMFRTTAFVMQFSFNRWRVRKFTCSSAPFISHCVVPISSGAIAKKKNTNNNNNISTVSNKVSADGFHFRGNSVDQPGLSRRMFNSKLLARG
jgi:hypothetical protein